MKLIDPKILEAPETWSENIARSTDPPEWLAILAKGGYTVHPVPAPTSTKAEPNRSNNEGGNKWTRYRSL